MKRLGMFKHISKSQVFPFTALFIIAIFFLASPALGGERVDDGTEFIPDSLLSIADGYAIVVDKAMQRLFVYRYDGSSFDRAYEARCSTGKKKGTKIETGDARTPEGIYFPMQAFSDSELSPIYGTMAFDLDYPNLLDRKEGKNGNNIWLHGTDKGLTPYQSNGCITLENGDIGAVSRFITLKETPFIIQDYIKWVLPSVQEAQREDILPIIKDWISAACDGDIEKMAALYGKDSPVDEEKISMLLVQIQKLRGYGGNVTLVPDGLSILKHDKYTVAIFRQKINLDGASIDAGLRKLFLKKTLNDWYVVGDAPLDQEKEGAVVADLQRISETYEGRDEISDVVNKWVSSWRAGDIEKYSSFYADDFRSRGMNRKAWISYKSQLFGTKEEVHIEIEDIKVTYKSSGRIVVAFRQDYQSPRVKDVGIKTLYMKKANSSWAIYKELWSRKR